MFAELGHRAERRGLRLLAAGVRVALGVEHQHVDVLRQAEDVIQTAEADVVGPAVTADQPDGFIHQVVGAGRQLARVFAFEIGQQRAQFGDLLTARLRRHVAHLQGIDQPLRQLRRQSIQQAQHSRAMLIDR